MFTDLIRANADLTLIQDGFTPLPDNDFPFPEEGHYITVCVALVSPKSSKYKLFGV